MWATLTVALGGKEGTRRDQGEGVKGKGGISAKALPSNGVQPLGLKQALFRWTATCFSFCFDRGEVFVCTAWAV